MQSVHHINQHVWIHAWGKCQYAHIGVYPKIIALTNARPMDSQEGWVTGVCESKARQVRGEESALWEMKFVLIKTFLRHITNTTCGGGNIGQQPHWMNCYAADTLWSLCLSLYGDWAVRTHPLAFSGTGAAASLSSYCSCIAGCNILPKYPGIPARSVCWPSNGWGNRKAVRASSKQILPSSRCCHHHLSQLKKGSGVGHLRKMVSSMASNVSHSTTADVFTGEAHDI